MRSFSIIGSIVVHAGIAFALLRAPVSSKPREPVAIEVERGETHAPPPRERPAVRPPQKIATLSRAAMPPQPTVAPRPSANEKPAPATPAAQAPFDTGLRLGNGGDGIAIPRGAPEKPAARPTAPPPPRRDPVPASVDSEQPCEEAPSKPTVLDRPTAIAYPADARAGGIEGRLILKITVGADGAARDVEVVEGVQAALDAAAIGAVRTWRFQPASRCGKRVDGGIYMLARRFELGD